MHRKPIQTWSAFLKDCALSRRRFFQAAAGTAAGVLGAGLFLPGKAQAQNECIFPKPTPVTLPADLFGPGIPPFPVHDSVGLADQNSDPTNITDFLGEIGNVIGGGTGTDGQGNTLLISVGAFKFTKGVYVGVDGKFHWGAFAFI
jgi:hypothetical protein